MFCLSEKAMNVDWKKLVDIFSYFPKVIPYQPASFSEIQKYCLSYHHLLSSVYFIAEVTSNIEADNWSGRFFSKTQQRPIVNSPS